MIKMLTLLRCSVMKPISPLSRRFLRIVLNNLICSHLFSNRRSKRKRRCYRILLVPRTFSKVVSLSGHGISLFNFQIHELYSRWTIEKPTGRWRALDRYPSRPRRKPNRSPPSLRCDVRTTRDQAQSPSHPEVVSQVFRCLCFVSIF